MLLAVQSVSPLTCLFITCVCCVGTALYVFPLAASHSSFLLSNVMSCWIFDGVTVTSSWPHHLVLTTLHWLPVHKRVVFQMVVKAWKCLNGTAPRLPLQTPAFLLPLVRRVISMSAVRSASSIYCKFPEPVPRSASRVLLLRDYHCGTVFLLLYGDLGLQ